MFSTRICIITTNKKRYSETFIQNHITHLPFEKKVLYKGMSTILYDWETDQPIHNPKLYKLKKFIQSVWKQFSEENFVADYLSNYLIKHRIQVVLAEFGPVGANVAKACAKANIPLIVHFHGDDAHAERFINRYEGYYKVIQHAKAVVCVSEPMKESLLRLGFTEEQLHLIPYGIDPSFFSDGNPALSACNFLATGRFVDKKAPHLLILAFQKVLLEVPDAKLYMIGIGPLLTACKSLVKALGMEQQVIFKGICDQQEVQAYLRNARAFLMHSITPETGEKEGTPLSILEASATGIPVVSTYHAGIPKAVLHDKTGFLVRECDIESMAKYIVNLAQDPNLAQLMGKEGRKHIIAHYNLSEQLAKLASVIEGVSKNENSIYQPRSRALRSDKISH